MLSSPSAKSACCLMMAAVISGLAGCGPSPASPAKNSAATTQTSPKQTDDPSAAESSDRPKRRGPVKLGSDGAEENNAATAAETSEAIVEALKPLQILLGKWKGLSRKAVSDEPQWVWDFQTDPKRPALTYASENGEYVRSARLTYLPKSDEYELTATDAEDQKRTYRGSFTEPVQDVPGDDNKLQRKYRLELIEAEPVKPGEVWQLAFAQQENDRYLMEVSRKRGSGPFSRIDTVHTQREGTSFANNSASYGDKTCVISQGLGTIAVSYQGKSYWVCCTGCKAAFEEDPEKWIARYETQKMKK